MDVLDGILKNFFYQFCNIAKWVFAFRMASDVIKRGNEGDYQAALKAIANGSIGYGCLYSIVYFLDLVQNTIQTAFK